MSAEILQFSKASNVIQLRPYKRTLDVNQAILNIAMDVEVIRRHIEAHGSAVLQDKFNESKLANSMERTSLMLNTARSDRDKANKPKYQEE